MSINFGIKTPVGLRPIPFTESGSKSIAQSSNSLRRTINGLAAGLDLSVIIICLPDGFVKRLILTFYESVPVDSFV